MIFRLIPAGLLTAMILAMPVSRAADADAGKALHSKNCTACHDSSVYTRDNRRVTSAAGLRKQIQRCELSQGLKWFDDDVDNVQAWLNSQYYHFK